MVNPELMTLEHTPNHIGRRYQWQHVLNVELTQAGDFVKPASPFFARIAS